MEDEFIGLADLNTVRTEVFHNQSRQVLFEIEEYVRENRWEDILALFYPVDSKLPDLVAKGMDVEIRSKLGFALGHLRRFDDTLAELTICATRDPENFSHHASLAYTAYNSMKEFNRARSVLLQALERDNRSRHKSLIRLVRIEYIHGNYQKASDYALASVKFYLDNWGKPFDEGLFWQAACQLRLGHPKAALVLAQELITLNPRYPTKLDRLMEAVRT